MSNDVLTIYEGDVLVISDDEVELLEVAAQGLPGRDGSGTVTTVVFASPTTSVQVLHNLNRPVFVTVLNTSGEIVVAEVQHTSLNEFYVRFGFPQTGKVIYL